MLYSSPGPFQESAAFRNKKTLGIGRPERLLHGSSVVVSFAINFSSLHPDSNKHYVHQ